MKNESYHPFPQSTLLYITSKIVLWTWCWLVLSIVGMIGGVVTQIDYFLFPWIIFLPSALVYGVLAFIIKCPTCKKAVTVQPVKLPPYAKKNNIYGFSGWSGIILNVFFNKKFICMHCGSRFKIDGLVKSRK